MYPGQAVTKATEIVSQNNYILTDVIVTHSNINSIQHLYKAITVINNIII